MCLLKADRESRKGIDRVSDFDRESYLFGRCHLYALVLSKMTGHQIEMLWDDGYWHGGAEVASKVLVHVYIVTPDVDGLLTKERLYEEYECEELSFEKVLTEQLRKRIQSNVLEAFDSEEERKIRSFILSQKDYGYLFNGIK